MQELKPCPCCGSSNGLYVLQEDKYGEWSVFCDMCKTSLHNENHCETRDDAVSAWNRRADLIEPSGCECVPGECPLNVRHDNDRIDQERLLAIATMMAADSVRSAKQGISVSPVYILHAARNIAEACGETFGSIRNRELAEWGTSIVPKETIVDRDALVGLADELDRVGYNDWPHSGVWEPEEIARRIRGACGEEVRNG